MKESIRLERRLAKVIALKKALQLEKDNLPDAIAKAKEREAEADDKRLCESICGHITGDWLLLVESGISYRQILALKMIDQNVNALAKVFGISHSTALGVRRRAIHRLTRENRREIALRLFTRERLLDLNWN